MMHKPLNITCPPQQRNSQNIKTTVLKRSTSVKIYCWLFVCVEKERWPQDVIRDNIYLLIYISNNTHIQRYTYSCRVVPVF